MQSGHSLGGECLVPFVGGNDFVLPSFFQDFLFLLITHVLGDSLGGAPRLFVLQGHTQTTHACKYCCYIFQLRNLSLSLISSTCGL